jgi:uncharacterized protein YjbI with pentapeptide repeats
VGKTFKLTGALYSGYPDRATRLVGTEGGRIVPNITATLDFLVEFHANRDSRADRKKVRELNESAGAAIQVLTGEQFNDLFLPDPTLALALLRSGPAGVERFNLARAGTRVVLDLGGADLRDLALAGVNLGHVNLDGADLRGADLGKAWLPVLAGALLDGANLTEARIAGFRNCSLRQANLTRAQPERPLGHWGCLPIERCDLTGANLTDAVLHDLAPVDSVFHEADLGGVDWDAGQLKGVDLRRLHISQASFAAADLTGAQLAEARLDQANFLEANLTAADLTGANLRGTVLIDANLSRAVLDGADLAGANLMGANLTGVDLTRARGVDSARTAPAAKVGPNIREWEKLAGGARWLTTTARMALPEGRSVELWVQVSAHGRDVCTESRVSGPYLARLFYRIGPKTVGAAFIDLPRRWVDGELRLESVTARGSGVALRGKALTQLARRAWCEGCGVPVPSADDLKALDQQCKAGKQDLHGQMLADLRSGPEGIQRWNERGKKEGEKAGHFRKVDLSGVNLDGVNFQGLDFSGANLSGASLCQANLEGASFTEAFFKEANLREARLTRGNFRSADFDGADLRGAELFRARLVKARLKGADLTGAKAQHADLCGADLTGATLTGAMLVQARFDETTVFPAGFTSPVVMRWVGTGPDPRSAAPACVVSGSGDRDTAPP